MCRRAGSRRANLRGILCNFKENLEIHFSFKSVLETTRELLGRFFDKFSSSISEIPAQSVPSPLITAEDRAVRLSTLRRVIQGLFVAYFRSVTEAAESSVPIRD